MFWIFKTRWLCNIHFFFNLAIEKGTLHIHLVQEDVVMVSIGKQYANGFKSCHKRKGFIEVNPYYLSVTLSN